MKKITMIICILILVVTVSPVQAAPHQPTGERINILVSGEQEYPARTAFYIRQGWVGEVQPPHMIGLMRFELEVDGKIIPATYIDAVGAKDGIAHGWVYNFPDGMSGVHTFTGHWYIPCQQFLRYGLIEECPSPTAHIDLNTSVVVVTFTH